VAGTRKLLHSARLAQGQLTSAQPRRLQLRLELLRRLLRHVGILPRIGVQLPLVLELVAQRCSLGLEPVQFAQQPLLLL
jgi:hypothetical protein